MRQPSLKSRLRAGDIVFGPWCVLPSPEVIEIITRAGFDFVIVDKEHGAASFERAQEMVRAAQAQGAGAIIRLGQLDEDSILKALDIGADGVLVAHVEDADHARKVASFSKYHPSGSRGFSPFTRAGGFGGGVIGEHAARENERTLVGVILEGTAGIRNIDDILKVENIDLVYIGAYDLSQALGFPGQVNHPEVKKHLQTCIDKIRSAGIAAGGFVARNKEDIAWMRDIGMQFITYLPDCAAIYQCFEKATNQFATILKNKDKQ